MRGLFTTETTESTEEEKRERRERLIHITNNDVLPATLLAAIPKNLCPMQLLPANG